MVRPLLFTYTMPGATVYLLLLAVTLGCASSARILDEMDPQLPVPSDLPEPSDSSNAPDLAQVAAPTTVLPSGQIPATPAGGAMVADAGPPHPETEVTNTVATPVANVAPLPGPVATTSPTGPAPAGATSPATADADQPAGAEEPNTVAVPIADVAPIPGPALPGGQATVANADTHQPQLSFFMHDIMGGSHPSGRVVTGIIANSDASGVPFSKSNGGVFPITGGIPLINGNNGFINNNNAPFLAGLNGAPSNPVIQNNGNNNALSGGGGAQPFVTAGQLPPGATLQQLMFGSITVIDDELTEGHELGSAVIGKAQGFYLASSLDGSSHTIALTASMHGGDHHDEEEDTLNFFGVHRAATPQSDIAVVGGTGKYENARGYATVETLHHEDQHTTDGVETILQFSVYLTA